MKLKSGFTVKEIMKAMRTNFVVTALAEEGDPKPTDPTPSPNPNPTPAPSINFEDLISKARKEEKDKLYPKISALEINVKDLTDKNNAHLLTIGEKDKEIASLNAKIKELTEATQKTESEQVSALQKEVKKLEKQIKDMESNTVSVEEIEAKIRGEYDVKLHREQLLRKATEENVGIIPELIMGTTVEELDNSFEVSKTRFTEIVGKYAPTPSTKVPSANISTTKLNMKDYKLEDLATMDPRSPEYKELRKQLGLK